jgi:hypothetical protein
MHAFGQHAHGEHAHRDAAQRCRQPELVVVAASGIEADHQRRLAEPVGEMVDVGRQVVGTGFLAGFDQHHAAARFTFWSASASSAVSAPNIA